MTLALRNAGVAPDEIDYIVAHGTATQLNDVTETRAIKAAYGDHAYKVAISSPKSMIGHLVGAAGIASRARRDRGDPRPGHPADGQPAHPRSRVRPRLRAADRAQGEGRDGRRSTASGSAARTRSAIFRASSTRPSSKRPTLVRLDARRRARPTGRPARRRVVVAHQDRFADRDEPRLLALDAASSRCSSVNDERPIRVARVSTVTISPWNAGAR